MRWNDRVVARKGKLDVTQKRIVEHVLVPFCYRTSLCLPPLRSLFGGHLKVKISETG